jgi:pyruvate/2-oxoglutarate dehydrogenase complex dihydrolipoamide acyltransferase (E2) component
MAHEFKLPDLGEGLTEGEVARWLVEEGQEVAEDDPLVEVQTDKTVVEIPSPAAGTVARILVAEGEVVPVGTVLVVIGEDAPAAGPSQAATRPPAGIPRTRRAEPVRQEQVRATPLVRRLARERGIDLTRLTGTGPGGRIVEADLAAASEAPRTRPGDAPETPQGRPEVALESPQRQVGHVSEGRREPIRGVRRQIVEHLGRAHREVPAVTFVEECDFTGIDTKRLVPQALRACAAALAAFPELNARLEQDEIVYLSRYDIGVAVQTAQGLVVPVVRGCDTASLDELDAEVRRLADAARAGTLKPGELRGGTFTLTSAGKLGGLLVTPLVNHPEVAILGIHRIADRPTVRDGQVVIRRIGNVSTTFDHRVVDGARAAAFTLNVIERLEAEAAR